MKKPALAAEPNAAISLSKRKQLKGRYPRYIPSHSNIIHVTGLIIPEFNAAVLNPISKNPESMMKLLILNAFLLSVTSISEPITINTLSAMGSSDQVNIIELPPIPIDDHISVAKLSRKSL